MSPVVRDTTFIDNRSPNMASMFLDRVEKSPSREAFRFPVSDGQPWASITWKETGDRVEKLAAGLLSLGLESEQRVGIASGTRVDWILADLAVMCAGGATTTVYPSTMSSDVAYILADSECRVVFARTTPRSRSCASTSPSCRTWPRWSSSTARRTRTGSSTSQS